MDNNADIPVECQRVRNGEKCGNITKVKQGALLPGGSVEAICDLCGGLSYHKPA